MSEVRGRIVQHKIVGRLFGGLGVDAISRLASAQSLIVPCNAVADDGFWRLTVKPRYALVNAAVDQFLSFDAPEDSGTSPALVLEGFNSAPPDPRLLCLHGSTDLPTPGGIKGGGRVIVCYRAAGQFELVAPFVPPASGAVSDFNVTCVQTNVSGNDIETTMADGEVMPSDMFKAVLTVEITADQAAEGGVIFEFDEINPGDPRFGLLLNGDQIPGSFLKAGMLTQWQYRPAGQYVLRYPLPIEGGGVYFATTIRTDATTNSWEAAPRVGLPNATGYGVTLRIPIPAAQKPVEGGITLKVSTINPDDALQVLDVDEVSQLDWSRLQTATAVDVTRIVDGGWRLEEIIGDDEAEVPVVGDPIGDFFALHAAARATQLGQENQAELDALKSATGFDGTHLAKAPFPGGDLAEGGGGLQFAGSQLLSWPAAYLNDDLTLDFVNGFYAVGGERTRALRALPGFSYARTGNKGEYDGTRVLFQNASVPAILAGVGYYSRQSLTNLFTGSAFLTTQNVTTAAADYTLSFIGTGTVTLSGAYAGVLVGTGANNRVSLTFTAAAGTLTATVAGTVRLASIVLGTLRGPIIITPTGASATVGADTLQVSYSLDDEPFLMMVKVDLKLAGFTTRLLCLNEANSTNAIRFERLATNQLRAAATVGGVAVAVGQIAANLTSTTGVVVLAIRRDAAGKFSEAARHVNGDCVVAAPGAAAAMPPGMVRLDIGNFFGGDQPRSPIQMVRCLRGNFTDAQVVALLATA